MKTTVFIFVPVYIDKNAEGPFRARASDECRKTRRLLFARPARIGRDQPFWTWFIDNPRQQSSR
jgi:hypothetical protein